MQQPFAPTPPKPPADVDRAANVERLSPPGIGSTEPVGAVDADLADLVATLTRRCGELFAVGDTAQVLADDLVERAEADAAAILVPDGAIWRVSGSVGLRPMERRAVLDAGHWLISEIALGGQVLLLQDTAGVRSKLAGAPLATWRHLLVIPVPRVRALAMLARGPAAQAFGESDLTGLVGPVSEAAELLATALRTRHLARMLAPLRERDEPGMA